jgi:hypothetical protein
MHVQNHVTLVRLIDRIWRLYYFVQMWFVRVFFQEAIASQVCARQGIIALQARAQQQRLLAVAKPHTVITTTQRQQIFLATTCISSS